MNKNFDIKDFSSWKKSMSNVTHESNYYYNKGLQSDLSLLEALVINEKAELKESMNSLELDYDIIDRDITRAVFESLKDNCLEPLNEAESTLKKRIQHKIESAGKIIKKGIQIGDNFFTKVGEIASKLGNVISRLIEKIKTFLSIVWDWTVEKTVPIFKKVKDFLVKDSASVLVSSLSTILKKKSAEHEMIEAPKDLKGAITRIKGKTYSIDDVGMKHALSDDIEKLKNIDDEKEFQKELDKIDVGPDEIISHITENDIHDILLTTKGFLLEGNSIEELEVFMNDGLMENETAHKKGLIGWLIEAIGFALSPITKLYTFLLKASTNGILISMSALSRGSLKNAYQYVVLGTIVGLTYEIIHSTGTISDHLLKVHESVSEKKTLESFKRLFDLENAKETLIPVLGGIFTNVLSSFFPGVGLVLEAVITSVASFELITGFCELEHKFEEMSVCSLALKAEHHLEEFFKPGKKKSHKEESSSGSHSVQF